jgi:hypothetical protein
MNAMQGPECVGRIANGALRLSFRFAMFLGRERARLLLAQQWIGIDVYAVPEILGIRDLGN